MTKIFHNKIFWIVAGICLLLFYFVFDPLESRLMPQCVFYKFTGLQCMGCGTQRMVHALLHGDFSGAIHANAFIFFSLPFLAFLVYVEIRKGIHPRLYKRFHSQWMIITYSSLLVLWMLFRNL